MARKACNCARRRCARGQLATSLRLQGEVWQSDGPCSSSRKFERKSICGRFTSQPARVPVATEAQKASMSALVEMCVLQQRMDQPRTWEARKECGARGDLARRAAFRMWPHVSKATPPDLHGM